MGTMRKTLQTLHERSIEATNQVAACLLTEEEYDTEAKNRYHAARHVLALLEATRNDTIEEICRCLEYVYEGMGSRMPDILQRDLNSLRLRKTFQTKEVAEEGTVLNNLRQEIRNLQTDRQVFLQQRDAAAQELRYCEDLIVHGGKEPGRWMVEHPDRPRSLLVSSLESLVRREQESRDKVVAVLQQNHELQREVAHLTEEKNHYRDLYFRRKKETQEDQHDGFPAQNQ